MASVKVILNRYKVNNDGSHPIVLQIIKDRRKKVLWLGYSAKLSQWDSEKNLPKRNHSNSARLRNLILSKLTEVEGIFLDLDDSGKPYTAQDVIDKLTIDERSDNLFVFTEKEIEKMKFLGQKGNAAIYQNTLNVYKNFRDEKDIALKHIDVRELNKFKDHLISKGSMPNTISFHLKTLRAIYNRAIKAKAVSENLFPFKNFPIKIHSTEKRAIQKEDIDKITLLNLEVRPDLVLPRDLFLFSFYMRGMSFVDIAYLKVSNIHGERLTYERKKTKQKFSIRLTEKAKEIIKRYNDLKLKKSYIFPILQREGQEYLDYRNAMRLMNKKLKDIGVLAELEEPLSTYTARHSWATIAKRMGEATAVISEGLGHDSEKTTQIYLDSFENDVLDEANERITG